MSGGDSEPFRVLAVCIGNVCRSPLMERLLRDRLPGEVVVESAGLLAMVGEPMEPNAAAELTRLGGSADGFTARQFQHHMAAKADLVLAATADVRSRVLEEYPSALRRSFTLLEFAYLAPQAPRELSSPTELIAWAAANRSLALGQELDIIDPIGRGPEVHRQAADLIDGAVGFIAAALGGVTEPS